MFFPWRVILSEQRSTVPSIFRWSAFLSDRTFPWSTRWSPPYKAFFRDLILLVLSPFPWTLQVEFDWFFKSHTIKFVRKTNFNLFELSRAWARAHVISAQVRSNFLNGLIKIDVNFVRDENAFVRMICMPESVISKCRIWFWPICRQNIWVASKNLLQWPELDRTLISAISVNGW